MATSDLCEYLKRRGASGVSGTTASNAGSPLDNNTEKRVCASVLKLLDDASHDVQTMAVKTLSVLLTTVHEDQVVEIAERLGSLLLDTSKGELRDVYAIGLRTLVKTIPMEMGDHVSERLMAKLLAGIRGNPVNAEDKVNAKASLQITVSCLEILADLVERFGTLPHTSRQQHVMVQATLSQLGSDSAIVRKRAGNTLGSLSVILEDTLLFQLVEILLAQIDASSVTRSQSTGRVTRSISKTQVKVPSYAGLELSSLGSFMEADAKTLIRTMSTLSGAIGHRLGQEQIDRIVPIFLKFCDPKDAIAGDDDAQDEDMDMSESALALINELREGCFAGFQSFILRCHSFVVPHLPKIIQSSLAYMRYDPNYSYGDEDVEDEPDDADIDPEDDEDDDNEDFEEDEDFDDEGVDDSWKVRRSAIQVLIAVSQSSKQEDIVQLWSEDFMWKMNNKKKYSVVAALVDRFKEREENCRVDIVECFSSILSSTIAAEACGKVTFNEGSMAMGNSNASSIDLQSTIVPKVVAASDKKLLAIKKGGTRTKAAALALLSILCNIPGGIGGPKQLHSVFIHLKTMLNSEVGTSGSHGSSKALKLDALRLIRATLVSSNHQAVDLKDVCKLLITDLCSVTQESWYKVVAEGLRVLSEIPRVLVNGQGKTAEKENISRQIFAAIEPRLVAQDQDQEIKECALNATSLLLRILHPYLLTEQKQRLLNLILDKLRSETTRLAATKALIVITVNKNAQGENANLDMSPIFSQTLTELAYLLRLSNRAIKQSVLECLAVILQSTSVETGLALTSDLCELIVKEISSIIMGSDMHMSHLSIQVATSLLRTYPSSSIVSVREFTIPAALTLAISPMMQDSTLDSLQSFLQVLVSSETVSCQQLLDQLVNATAKISNDSLRSSGTKQAVGNLAKCIAAVVTSGSAQDKRKVFIDMLSVMERKTSGLQQMLYLRAVGDIGSAFDFSTGDELSDRLEKCFLSALDSSSEDEKHASAYGLGRVTAGAVPVFLPKLLGALNGESQKKQYLLLSSVREFIHSLQKSSHSQDENANVIDQLWPYMKTHCADKEEGIRTMVAECIGSMIILDPAFTLPRVVSLVDEGISEPAANRINVCSTVATSVKFAIAGRANSEVLSKDMPIFLKLLNEEDLGVKNAALLIVYSAVHHDPKLVLGHMQEHILHHLYKVPFHCVYV